MFFQRPEKVKKNDRPQRHSPRRPLLFLALPLLLGLGSSQARTSQSWLLGAGPSWLCLSQSWLLEAWPLWPCLSQSWLLGAWPLWLCLSQSWLLGAGPLWLCLSQSLLLGAGPSWPCFFQSLLPGVGLRGCASSDFCVDMICFRYLNHSKHVRKKRLGEQLTELISQIPRTPFREGAASLHWDRRVTSWWPPVPPNSMLMGMWFSICEINSSETPFLDMAFKTYLLQH